ncbi:hypothetical protein G6F46_006675 [Rhizopus delemar]|uniref:Band 7 domain-containing protein n=3 Tax=Rhizopus TaxID=4842 RepID=I1BW15_RHIO9|nr:hypothetical protein RO3G_05100 [Rhizopus delemar RA 99-880]KAG1050425.1 hypothetical protein G6F43_007301 [Rhizopus delemar]KAG1543262.1 hypothetical protein G6F51_006782 [Rhizopus arrhizus]KAG1458317.1 hypothetical protein G6F55_005417 [Rhizopus delemar]KAG1497155.1 hypothetical protein G6F54_005961 [Rhizopus delemar]|eukprot:EIE80395.1 hypothetical protein RO3G_05100 [Rhizopus delemar RA 99-880]
MSIQDSSPLIRSGYDAKASPSVAGEPSHTVKQVKGDFATNGVQPSFALELDISTIKHGWYGNMMNGIGSIIGALGSIPCCVCCPNPYKPIKQGHVGLISRFGKFYKCVDPGLVKINPVTERIQRVDVKIQIADIPRQYIMTKDNVTVLIDSVLYWHIIDPYQAQFGVRDVKKALIERTQTTLRHILGGKVLQECVENRESIAQEVQAITGSVAAEWGVKIESILIKDFSFSKELQESLSAAAQAKRTGQSKVITARAEVDAAKLMREAADILSTSSAMQIRYLDTLTNLSKAQNTSVVFLPPSADNAAFIKDGQGQVTSVNALQAQNFLNIASQRALQ